MGPLFWLTVPVVLTTAAEEKAKSKKVRKPSWISRAWQGLWRKVFGDLSNLT